MRPPSFFKVEVEKISHGSFLKFLKTPTDDQSEVDSEARRPCDASSCAGLPPPPPDYESCARRHTAKDPCCSIAHVANVVAGKCDVWRNHVANCAVAATVHAHAACSSWRLRVIFAARCASIYERHDSGWKRHLRYIGGSAGGRVIWVWRVFKTGSGMFKLRATGMVVNHVGWATTFGI